MLLTENTSRPRFFSFALTLVLSIFAFVLFQPTTVRGAEVASNNKSTVGTKNHWLSFLIGARGGLGSYTNISRQRGDPPSPMQTGSYAGFFDIGFGLEAFGLGFSSNWNPIRSPTITYVDKDNYVHEAESSCIRIKTYYALRSNRFHLIPEFGYVYLGEGASIHDVRSKRPDRYNEVYEDKSYEYGLSARAKIIPVPNWHLWFYASYVHDNLDIKVDNYLLQLQLGDEFSGPSDVNEKGPEVKSGYFGLGVS